jgi:hypothetical protein
MDDLEAAYEQETEVGFVLTVRHWCWVRVEIPD